MAVPGITPEIADAIVGYRQNKRLMSAQEVGIPPQSAPYISFSDSNTYSFETLGYRGDVTKGYPIKAVVTLEATNYKYIYYKSPATTNQ